MMIAGAEISTGDDGDDVIYREKKNRFEIESTLVHIS